MGAEFNKAKHLSGVLERRVLTVGEICIIPFYLCSFLFFFPPACELVFNIDHHVGILVIWK